MQKLLNSFEGGRAAAAVGGISIVKRRNEIKKEEADNMEIG